MSLKDQYMGPRDRRVRLAIEKVHDGEADFLDLTESLNLAQHEVSSAFLHLDRAGIIKVVGEGTERTAVMPRLTMSAAHYNTTSAEESFQRLDLIGEVGRFKTEKFTPTRLTSKVRGEGDLRVIVEIEDSQIIDNLPREQARGCDFVISHPDFVSPISGYVYDVDENPEDCDIYTLYEDGN